jgi:signal transduction histidine kinase/ActR/RegA family two-component response regulator
MLVDISERQRAEAALRELNETLERRVESEIGAPLRAEQAFRQAQKMEVIGQLTGGVAHDFNNLLTAVMGNLDLIAGRTDDREVRKLAEGALRAAKRGATLTHQLLAFARQQRLELRPANVNDLVTGMADMLLRTLGGTVRVELAVADRLWPALIDANQIENAILNLAINARDAMPEGGTLTLETANLRVGQLHRPGGLEPGDYVVIAVADTGTGMSDDVKAKAFEPFFTTKEVGKGSGLGLSQVYGVVRQSGGAVELDSTPGCGTTVRLYLPRARARRPEPSGEPGRRLESAVNRGKRVLVVDDDDDVREAVVALLTRLGYEAAAVPSAAAALERFAAEAFDLALVDFAMPGMNGIEAGRVMRARWPELPVLFMTGHADAPALGDEIAAGSTLRKPFVAAELEARIAGLLEREAARRGAPNVVPLRAEGR